MADSNRVLQKFLLFTGIQYIMALEKTNIGAR